MDFGLRIGHVAAEPLRASPEPPVEHAGALTSPEISLSNARLPRTDALAPLTPHSPAHPRRRTSSALPPIQRHGDTRAVGSGSSVKLSRPSTLRAQAPPALVPHGKPLMRVSDASARVPAPRAAGPQAGAVRRQPPDLQSVLVTPDASAYHATGPQVGAVRRQPSDLQSMLATPEASELTIVRSQDTRERVFGESTRTRTSLAHKFKFEQQQLQQLCAGAVELVPYHQQGDPEFDAPSPMRQRKQLFDSGSAQLGVVARLFWTAGRLPPDGAMSRATYLTIHRLICKAIASDLSESAARRAAHADWAHDAAGARSLGFGAFTGSLFDLADQWTDSVDLADYLHFLQVLFLRVTKAVRDSNAPAGSSVRVFRRFDDVASISMEALRHTHSQYRPHGAQLAPDARTDGADGAPRDSEREDGAQRSWFEQQQQLARDRGERPSARTLVAAGSELHASDARWGMAKAVALAVVRLAARNALLRRAARKSGVDSANSGAPLATAAPSAQAPALAASESESEDESIFGEAGAIEVADEARWQQVGGGGADGVGGASRASEAHEGTRQSPAARCASPGPASAPTAPAAPSLSPPLASNAPPRVEHPVIDAIVRKVRGALYGKDVGRLCATPEWASMGKDVFERFVRKVVRITPAQLTPSDCAALHGFLDRNADGVVSVDELLHFVTAQASSLPVGSEAANTRADGASDEPRGGRVKRSVSMGAARRVSGASGEASTRAADAMRPLRHVRDVDAAAVAGKLLPGRPLGLAPTPAAQRLSLPLGSLPVRPASTGDSDGALGDIGSVAHEPTGASPSQSAGKTAAALLPARRQSFTPAATALRLDALNACGKQSERSATQPPLRGVSTLGPRTGTGADGKVELTQRQSHGSPGAPT
ncbi:hypothetical protein KFE25_008827 [Diacronema lutheri]|uniref:EF-hand domain-containing protein n=3 Tax=Diacronema lutheri TaxID=2081491 RepID=A0A8J6CGR7_DIALT|nr:hypothetical protein KFE25_008827 [Diacronema lutheri]